MDTRELRQARLACQHHSPSTTLSPPQATEEEVSGWKTARGLSSLHRRERPGAPCSRAPRRMLCSRQKGCKDGTEDQLLPSTLPGRDPGHSLLDLLPSGSCCRTLCSQDQLLLETKTHLLDNHSVQEYNQWMDTEWGCSNQSAADECRSTFGDQLMVSKEAHQKVRSDAVLCQAASLQCSDTPQEQSGAQAALSPVSLSNLFPNICESRGML